MIQAMFNRIRMTERGARYHRLLWYNENNSKTTVYQMDRVAFGNCCSPYVTVYPRYRVAKGKEQSKRDKTYIKASSLWIERRRLDIKSQRRIVYTCRGGLPTNEVEFWLTKSNWGYKRIQITRESNRLRIEIRCWRKREWISTQDSVVSVGRHNFAEPQYKDAKFIRRELKTYLWKYMIL